MQLPEELASDIIRLQNLREAGCRRLLLQRLNLLIPFHITAFTR